MEIKRMFFPRKSVASLGKFSEVPHGLEKSNDFSFLNIFSPNFALAKLNPCDNLKSLCVILIFFLLAFQIFAQNIEFPQKIEWKSNANALEYRVEVQNTATGKSQTIKTDKTSTEVSLAPGKYRYRVTAYDFLGKEASVSSWTNFEVFKANTPKIKNVEKKVIIPKDSTSVGIDVAINDVNSASKFELVNDGLEGTFPASDRSKMQTGASETDSVTHLYFKDVPPGKWRLRVTNPSGFVSVSDVITIEGEKTYTAAEVAQIKAEAEKAVRKEIQDNLDEYIKKAEAEKKAEQERIAREKAAEEERQRIAREEAEKKRLAEEAKAKAEREAEERRIAEENRRKEEARIAEEKRLAAEKAEAERRAKEEEQRRIAEEKARREAEEIARKEEEKRKKAEWKAAHPYQWKDIIFEGGAGYSFNLLSNTVSDIYETKSLAFTGRMIFLPWKGENNKFGMEFGFLTTNFKTEDSYFYEGELNSTDFDVKFVWQHNLLFKKIYGSLKAGVGLNKIDTKLSYISKDSNRADPSDKSYFYPSVTAGASLFFYPWKFVVFELGADFTYVLSGDVPLGLATPYACIGFRF